MRNVFILNCYEVDLSRQVSCMLAFLEKMTFKDNEENHHSNKYLESTVLVFGIQDEIDINLPEDVIPIYIKTEVLDANSIVKGVIKYINKEDRVLFQDDIISNEAAVKLATKLQRDVYTNVVSIQADKYIEQKVLSGNMLFKKKINNENIIATVDKSISAKESPNINHKNWKLKFLYEISHFNDSNSRDEEILPHKEEKELNKSNFIIVFGRGVGNKNNMLYGEEIAKKIGASVGASRPVVMNAWASMDKLIGVSGNMVSPKLCILCGVSGSPAFYAGVEGSETIIAINNDCEATIVGKSDAYICSEWQDILAKLLEVSSKYIDLK